MFVDDKKTKYQIQKPFAGLSCGESRVWESLCFFHHGAVVPCRAVLAPYVMRPHRAAATRSFNSLSKQLFHLIRSDPSLVSIVTSQILYSVSFLL